MDGDQPHVICYASQTNTRRNVALMRLAGWRFILSPLGSTRHHGLRYALDNGAWGAHQAGQPFPHDAFMRRVDQMASGADFVVLPDIVAGGMASLDLSLGYLPKLAGLPLMLVVQDGMAEADVLPHIGPGIGIFLGGSTAWKLETMAAWGDLAARAAVPFHVGRVNSVKRIRMAHAAGATSFDGSSVTRYALTLPALDVAARSPDFFSPRRA